MATGSLLRQPGLLSVLSAELISLSGTKMTVIALPWFVLVTTGSAARTTLVMASAVLGLAVCGIPGGSLANRLGARRSMLTAHLARAPLIALVPFLHDLGGLRFWMLPLIAFAVEAFTAPYEASQATLLAELAGDDQARLARATALFQAGVRSTDFIGPALAGVLISVVGAAQVLWVDAASYLVAFVLVLSVRAAPAAAPETEDLQGLLSGVRFLFGDPFLRLFAIVLTIFEAGFGALIVMFPILAFRRYDADPHVAGALLAAMGAGALVGSAVAYRIVERFPPFRLGAAAAIAQAAPLWVLVFPVSRELAVAAMALSGLFAPIANAPTFALVTLRIPPAMRPTVLAAFGTISFSGAPVAIALIGPLSAAAGVSAALAVIAGAVSLAVALFVVGGRGLVPQEAGGAVPDNA